MAVTVAEVASDTAQGLVPEQPPPLQPTKVEPTSGVGVRVMLLPVATVSVQSAPHVMPVPVTVPVPVPVLVTVSTEVGPEKAASMMVSPVKTYEQVPVPLQPPPVHPMKVEPAVAVAVRVMAKP